MRARSLSRSRPGVGHRRESVVGATLIAVVAAVPLLAGAAAGRVASALRHDTASSTSAPSFERPGHDMAIVRAHRYRMAGRIRPLLAFWIGRDHVGAGSILWREDGTGGVAYELLMGADPALAPRGINRWGYIAEEARAGRSSILGIITESDERSREEVEAGLGRQGVRFKTVQTLIDGGVSRSRVSLIESPSGLTLHQAPDAVSLVRQDASGSERTLALDADVRSGFLSSMAELVAAGVTSGGGRSRTQRPRVLRYVHGSKVYVLTLRAEHRLQTLQLCDRTYTNVVRGRFETAAEDRSGEDFEVIYGTEGVLAGVPIFIQYQPRWWLRVELVLDN